MCAGPPGVEVVLPRVGAGLDGGEAVGAVRAGDAAAHAGEVGVQRRRVLVALVDVAAGGVGLPDFHELAGHGAAVAVEHAAGDDDAFALRLAVVLDGQVRLQGVHVLVAERRGMQLDGLRVRVVQALGGVAQDAAAVRGEVQPWLGFLGRTVLQGLGVGLAERLDLGAEILLGFDAGRRSRGGLGGRFVQVGHCVGEVLGERVSVVRLKIHVFRHSSLLSVGGGMG